MPTFVKRAATASEVDALRENVSLPARLSDPRRSINEPNAAQAKTKPVSLLFTSASKVTPLYKALSTDFYRKMDFYAARDSKVGQDALASFGVDKVPALIVLKGEEMHKYDGGSAHSLSLPSCL